MALLPPQLCEPGQCTVPTGLPEGTPEHGPRAACTTTPLPCPRAQARTLATGMTSTSLAVTLCCTHAPQRAVIGYMRPTTAKATRTGSQCTRCWRIASKRLPVVYQGSVHACREHRHAPYGCRDRQKQGERVRSPWTFESPLWRLQHKKTCTRMTRTADA